MSDYMFMLESHLSTDQNRVVREVQTAASEAGMSLFLTGGAMRDMLGGSAIRDLDFCVEGDALKLAKGLARRKAAQIVSCDEHRNSAELVFPGGVTVEIAMARREQYSKPGARAQVAPATIHEDLRSRDLTVNAIALSLNRASRGLLIDPTNGLADIQHKELRAVGNYSLYDDPARILRLIRFRARLGFTVEERTQAQYQRVREAGLEERVSPRKLFDEVHHIANDPNPADVVRTLHQEGLLKLFSPALAGGKLNLAGLVRLQKARQLVPFGVYFPVENLGLFLSLLTEKLSPKEKAALIKGLALRKSEIDLWQKLEGRARKIERRLKSAKPRRPSEIYRVLAPAPGEEIFFLLTHSSLDLVRDRIRNCLQKYFPLAQEVTDEQVRAKGVEPGTPKYKKTKEELIQARLDARPKRPAPPPEPPPPERSPVGPPVRTGPAAFRKPLTRPVR
ncbi:MAG: hypothetical protein AAB225_13180 [Acidobacteriota bacterium]